jgi:hypothetical protein
VSLVRTRALRTRSGKIQPGPSMLLSRAMRHVARSQHCRDGTARTQCPTPAFGIGTSGATHDDRRSTRSFVVVRACSPFFAIGATHSTPASQAASERFLRGSSGSVARLIQLIQLPYPNSVSVATRGGTWRSPYHLTLITPETPIASNRRLRTPRRLVGEMDKPVGKRVGCLERVAAARMDHAKAGRRTVALS